MFGAGSALAVGLVAFVAWRIGHISRRAAPGFADERVLVIGLDGADWSIIEPLMAQGRMPHLKRLVESGTRARLLSLSPMLSPVVWTTVATGVPPTRHGVLDFVVQAADGTRQPVTSAQRQVPTVWEMLSRDGVAVGVVGWWATWPAEPVRGYLVSDRLAHQLFESDVTDGTGKTWPPELYAQIKPLIVDPHDVGWDRVQPYLSGTRMAPEQFDDEERRMIDDLRTVIASGETHMAVAQTLARQIHPRLSVVYFEGTDTVGHLFMRYRPPGLTGVPAEQQASFGAAVDRYYETADGFIGRLLEGQEPDTDVIVLSDHGFATDATRPQSTDSRIGHGAAADWHRRFGILVMSGPHVARGTEIAEATVYDIAPTILALFGRPIPRSWPGHVLTEGLDPAFVAAQPIRFADSDPDRGRRGPRAATDPQAEALLEKLRGLGYLAGGAGGPSTSVTERNNAGLSLMAQGRYADAEAEFRQALAGGGRRPIVVLNLGLAIRYQGRLAEARPLIEETLAHPVTRRIAGIQLSEMALASSDLESAERFARGVLAIEPQAAEAHSMVGRIAEARGDLAAAEREYRLATDLDADSALGPTNLGNLFKRRGDLAQAEGWYRKAIEADPYLMGAYNNLALVYQARGQVQAAIELYTRALAKSPDHAVVLNNLATLYYAQADGRRARELWERSAAADATYVSPLNNLAGLAITEGRFDDAERLLAQALALAPNYGDAHTNLALVLRARGDGEGARRELQRAVLDPEAGALAWVELGKMELQGGRIEAAVSVLQAAVHRVPGDVSALNALGEALLRAGRKADALNVWRRSLGLNPRQPEVRRAVEGK